MEPVIYLEEYTRGQVRILHQAFYCPVCGQLLDAAPDDLPERCDCGEKLDFGDVEFHEDKVIGLAGLM